MPSGGGELGSRGVGRRDGRVVDVELREVWETDWKRWRWAEEGRMKKLLEKLCFCSRWTRDAGRSRGRGRDWQGTTVCFVCHENEALLLSLADGTKEILVENGLLREKGRDARSGTAMAALVLRGGAADGNRGWREVVEKDVGRGEQCRFCLLTKFINAGPSLLAARRSGHPWANIAEKPAHRVSRASTSGKKGKIACAK